MSIYRKKRGIFVNIVLGYRYGWVDHILHSRPQETLTTHKNIQLRTSMRSFDSLREEQHFAAGCTLFQQLKRKRVGRVHVGKQAHFTYDSSINFKTGRFEAQAMSLSLFLYCFCDCLCRCRSFVLSSCRLSPFHLSNVTVSKPCRLWNFYPKQGLNNWRKLLFAPCKEIQYPGSWNPEYSCRNPESHLQLESGIQVLLKKILNPVIRIRNPQSKTVLDSLTQGRDCDVY